MNKSNQDVNQRIKAGPNNAVVSSPNRKTLKNPNPKDKSQKTEEEEIVAQVSSLISNMDINQQSKLMSQLLHGDVALQTSGDLNPATQIKAEENLKINIQKREPSQSQMSFGVQSQNQQQRIQQQNDQLLLQELDNEYLQNQCRGSSLVDEQNVQFLPARTQKQVYVQKQGFDVLRLSSPAIDHLNEDFLCGNCHKIVNDPLQCGNSDCSQLFCRECCKRDDKQCPSCNQGQMSTPSKIIMKIYAKYQINCNICCKAFPILDILEHEQNCQRKKCNNELCGVELNLEHQQTDPKLQQIVKFQINGNEMIACSKKCKKVAKFAYMLKRNNENEILKTFESMLRKKMQKNLEQASIQQRGIVAKSIIGLYGNKVSQGFQSQLINAEHARQNFNNNNRSKTVRSGRMQSNNTELRNRPEEENKISTYNSKFAGTAHNTIEDQIQYLYPESCGEFCWDSETSSKEITFSADFRHAFLYETNYYFRTIMANRPFFGGIHYWEIIADARTEHELKIGVTTEQTFNVNSSFSDYEFGFAYYGLGQLRHSDNSLGTPYGKFFKKKGVLGVLLNMNLGTMSFALDGEFMGVAFQDKLLTKGPIWAAVSLLHIGGLTLISGLEPPPYIPVNEQLKNES